MKIKSNQQGSAAVEALIVVPIMLMVLVSFLFIIRVYYVNATIQNALEHAAEDFSYYAVFYKRTGILEVSEEIKDYSKSKDQALEAMVLPIVEDIESIVREIESFSSQHTLGSLSELNDYSSQGSIWNVVNDYIRMVDGTSAEIEALISDLMELKKSLEGLVKKIELTLNDPDAANIVVGSAVHLLWTELETALGNFLIKSLMKQNISEEMMAKLVVEGYDGLNFKGSGYFLKHDDLQLPLDVMVTYDVKIIAPINFWGRLSMVNRVVINTWTSY